jgi:glycosyltransferase involved in cell wall biosynthesis
MIIAMVGTFSEEGGIKNHIHNLSTQLAKTEEHEIHIISFSERDAFLEENKIKIHFIKYEQTLYFNLFVGPSLVLKKLEEINPKVIHVHGAYLPYAKVLTDLKKSDNNIDKKIILTVHGSIRKELEVKYKSLIKYYKYAVLAIQLHYEKKSIIYADKVVAVSKSIKESIETISNNKPSIYIIPNGINIEMIDETHKRENLEKPSIIFVGRLVKIKGCDIAIEAIEKVKKKYPTVKLYIIGDGNQLHTLQQLTTHFKLEENIEFLGFLSAERFSYMKSADICVVPSKYEAFGIVVLEAMACRTPVIASKIGGMKDIIKDKNGCTFKVGDSNDLADKITTLLINKELSIEMSVNGRKEVEIKYQWEKIAKDTFELYLS